jgi:hypothetical protein
MGSRFLYIALVFGVMFIGCGQQKKESANSDGSVSKSESPPKIEFEQVYYDFGSMKQGEKVSYSFEFTNTGGSPLVIEEAYATCGCTVPEFSKEPVSPGEKGHVEVIFDSSGRRGNQYKSVVVKTNAPINKKRLTIKAKVLID